MNFVADMGVSRTTGEHLRDRGHDVIHLRQQDLEEGALVVVEDRRYRLRRLPIR